jgi:hypothetical protein
MNSAKTDVSEAARRHCRGIRNPGSDLRHQTACNTLAGNFTRIPTLRPVADEMGETSIKRVHRIERLDRDRNRATRPARQG